MKKTTREIVYQKYGGKCAYCGNEITLKEMQVDHILPKRLGGADSLENYSSSPIDCIEWFADKIADLEKKNAELEGICKDLSYKFDYQVKQAMKLEKENAELKQAKEGKIVEHFEAYGQCRDSRRIAELEAQIEKMKSCINCRYCINENCPWQPKGCGMKHWELRR